MEQLADHTAEFQYDTRGCMLFICFICCLTLTLTLTSTHDHFIQKRWTKKGKAQEGNHKWALKLNQTINSLLLIDAWNMPNSWFCFLNLDFLIKNLKFTESSEWHHQIMVLFFLSLLCSCSHPLNVLETKADKMMITNTTRLQLMQLRYSVRLLH